MLHQQVAAGELVDGDISSDFRDRLKKTLAEASRKVRDED